MATVKHPLFDAVTNEVPNTDLQDWLDQGWLPNEDGGPSSFAGLEAAGGEAPKSGPRSKRKTVGGDE